MICDGCFQECGALSYDIEKGAYLCPACRDKFGAGIKARRCPFCGAHDVNLTMEDKPFSERYLIYCLVCGASGPYCDSPAEALKEWNKAPRVRP